MGRFALRYANARGLASYKEDLYHALPNKFRNESQGRLGPWFTKIRLYRLSFGFHNHLFMSENILIALSTPEEKEESSCMPC